MTARNGKNDLAHITPPDIKFIIIKNSIQLKLIKSSKQKIRCANTFGNFGLDFVSLNTVDCRRPRHVCLDN